MGTLEEQMALVEFHVNGLLERCSQATSDPTMGVVLLGTAAGVLAATHPPALAKALSAVMDAHAEALGLESGVAPEVEVARLRVWVAELQAGMTVNCVYCGHSYGPKSSTPVTMADVLKAHIEVCPDHPMTALKFELEQVKAQLLTHENGGQ